MRFALLIPPLVAIGCTEHIGRDVPPLTAGPGVTVDPVTQTVSVDLGQVPIVPSCGAGQFVRHADAGWECGTPDWASLPGKPASFAPAPHTHVSTDVTDFGPASLAVHGAKSATNPLNHDRYTDGEAVGAMGVKANNNPLNHDRYSDSEAVTALSKATGTVGVGTASAGANLMVAGTLTVADHTQGPGKVFTSDVNGVGSWQTPPAAPAGVPSNAIMFFNLASCPTGWSEFTLGRGRYFVGLVMGGTGEATVGQALTEQENRPAGQHAHAINDPGHTHSYVNNGIYQNYCGGNYCQVQYGSPANTGQPQQPDGGPGTGITVAQFGTIAGTNAPYVQLLVCQKNPG